MFIISIEVDLQPLFVYKLRLSVGDMSGDLKIKHRHSQKQTPTGVGVKTDKGRGEILLLCFGLHQPSGDDQNLPYPEAVVAQGVVTTNLRGADAVLPEFHRIAGK